MDYYFVRYATFENDDPDEIFESGTVIENLNLADNPIMEIKEKINALQGWPEDYVSINILAINKI